MEQRVSITKQFDFCYGHRVWSQTLDTEFSLDGQCACRHLHGHQGTILISLTSADGTIADNGMITDFKHLNWFKKFLDDTFDHKFVIDRSDPLLNFFLDNKRFSYDGDCIMLSSSEGIYCVDPEVYNYGPIHEKEMYQGLVIVDFLPTSENFCSWLMGVVQKRMVKLNVVVNEIRFFETPKSQSFCRVEL
jgi:6-pyruvoyltetrahydropterin/6-carboxytetrahydropterin synthase